MSMSANDVEEGYFGWLNIIPAIGEKPTRIAEWALMFNKSCYFGQQPDGSCPINSAATRSPALTMISEGIVS